MSSVTVGGQMVLSSDGDFLEALAETWGDPQAAAEMGPAWGIQQADINTWQQMRNANQITDAECEVRTAITAAMSRHILEHRAKVTSKPIQIATPEQLDEFEEYYQAELRSIYTDMRAAAAEVEQPIDSPEWCQLDAKFQRLAGFLWQVKRMKGEV